MLPEVYAYEDYRAYLRDAFEALKADRDGLSQRDFAALCGFSNPGFFNDVLKGRRTLSEAAVEKLSKAFGLKGGESEYFFLLVDYGQLSKPEERQAIYEKLLFRRNRSSFVRVRPEASKYYQEWHYPVVRAAVEVFDFRGDYEALAHFIRPPLPVTVVKKCVRDLCDWGILEQDPAGRYRVIHRNQEPPASLNDVVKRLNREWVLQAAEALFSFPRDERHISAGMLTISEKTFHAIQNRIDKFREDVFALAKADEHPDRVMQLSLQFFPRTDRKGSRRNG